MPLAVKLPSRLRIMHAIDRLGEHPLKGRPLKGKRRELRRVRVGDYAIGYEVLSLLRMSDVVLALGGLATPALITRANLPQIGIGIDPLGMPVIPAELDGIAANRTGSRHRDRPLAQEGKGIGFRFDFRGGVPAQGARTLPAQVSIGVGGNMAIIPGDGHATRSREFDGGRNQFVVHDRLRGDLLLEASETGVDPVNRSPGPERLHC